MLIAINIATRWVKDRSILCLARFATPVGLACLMALVVASLGGCENEPIRATTRNLLRPGPMAMICASVDDQDQPTGRKLSECAGWSEGDPQPEPFLFGLAVNVGRGDIALFRTAGQGDFLVDLDPGPGFGFIPVGTQPSAIGTSQDGCVALTANHGSCDLSIIDVPALFNAACRALPASDDLGGLCGELNAAAGGLVSTITPHTASGPLLARPQDVVLVPEAPGGEEAGVCAPGQAYRAYVTFPGCNLVAEIDLKTGRLAGGLIITESGFEATDQPQCRPECSPSGAGGQPSADATTDTPVEAAPAIDSGGDTLTSDADATADAPADADVTTDVLADAATAAADAGADQSADGNGPIASAVGVLPFGLALHASGRQLYVSSAGANFISVIDLDESGSFVAHRRIVLEGSSARTTEIAVSPPSDILGEFIYAVANDHSVRVVSVAEERECEASVDIGLLVDDIPIERAACFPVEEAPRSALATSPGISFGSALPQDVVFIDVTPAEADKPTEPAARPLDGVFALVALSDGRVAVVDLGDRAFVSAGTQALPKTHLPHRLRNALSGSDDPDDSGVLAVTDTGKGGVPVVVSEVDGVALPSEGVYLRAPGESVSTVRLVYERLLVERFSAQLAIENDGLFIADRGASYCRAGVLGRVEHDGRAVRHGDIAELVGCNEDADCGVNQVCRKPVARQGDTGLCLDVDRQDELFTQCSPWLRGEREFLVRRAANGALAIDVLPIEPQPAVLQQTQPEGGCTDDADCEVYFLCAIADREILGAPGFSVRAGQCFRPGCEPADPDRQCPGDAVCVTPLDGSPPVCAPVPPPIDPWPAEQARTCQDDTQCQPSVATGSACEEDRDCGDDALECRRPDSRTDVRMCLSKSFVCAEFPGISGRRCLRPSPCFNELQHYTVRAGRTLIASGQLDRVIVDPETDECERDPTADPLLQDRIPIGLPVFPVLPGPVCEKTPSPGELPQPNPCFQRVDQGYGGFVEKQSETVFSFIEEPAPSTVVHYSNPRIWLSFGLSHMTRPTDDPAGTDQTTVVPAMPARNMVIDVFADSQYAPLPVLAPGSSSDNTASLVVLPFALVSSPDGYVYVSDTGGQSGVTGNRGQILRFSAVSVRLEDATVYVVR